MDVRLSPEQQALRSAATKVLDDLGPRVVPDLDDNDRAARLESVVRNAGWRDLRTSNNAGDPWASAVEVALIAEQMGRGCADVAFVGPTLAAELRRLAGAPDATEPETVALLPDLSGLATVGEDAVAVDAGQAALALVLRPVSGGHALATVPVRGGDVGIDLTRQIVPLASATAASVTGLESGLSDDSLTRWTALGLAAGVADLVGVMQGAMTLAVEYARQRTQFGKPIGSFQALRHLMADMVVHLEGSRSAGLYAAWGVDALEPRKALASAASAKAYASRAARLVCEGCIQVHAGMGHTWECMAHVFLRRAQFSADLLGGVGPNLDRVLAYKGIVAG